MTVLTLDTSQDEARVVLRRGEEILAERCGRSGRQVGRELLLAIDELLTATGQDLSSLDYIEVSAGTSQRTSRLRAGAVVGAVLTFAVGAMPDLQAEAPPAGGA